MGRPYSGIRPYAVMVHGLLSCPTTPSLLPEDFILLPDNVLVIMNCFAEAQLVLEDGLADQARLFKNYIDPIYKQIQNAPTEANIKLFVQKLLEITDITELNSYCVFHGACPNIEMSVEKRQWRDGVYELPIDCLPLNVMTSLNVHIKDGNMERCGDRYKAFFKPALGRRRESPYVNTHLERMNAIVKHQMPTLRDALDVFWRHKPNPEKHIQVVIVHACTSPRTADEDSSAPYAINYDSKPLTPENKSWLLQWFFARLPYSSAMEVDMGGGKKQVKKKKLDKTI